MKKLSCTLYSFDELSEDVQEQLCNKERERDYNWGYICQQSDYEERVATLDAFCKEFGISYKIDFDHNYRFINWNFDGSSLVGDMTCDEIFGKYLLRFLDRHYYAIRTQKWHYVDCDKEKNHGKGYKERRSRIIWEEQNCPFTGMCYDCDILQKIFEWHHAPNWKISLKELFADCFSYFMKSWSDEDDYRMSDENIKEMISANEEEKLYFKDGTEFTGDFEEVNCYLEEVA